jgi:hypothetical protein
MTLVQKKVVDSKKKAIELAKKKAADKIALNKKLAEQKKNMEMDDKLQREASMLENLIAADEEDKKSVNNDYFAKTSAQRKDTAFEDMKNGDNISDVSSLIIKKANKSWFKGLMPGSMFGTD